MFQSVGHPMSTQSALDIVSDPARAATLLQPLRLRLVEQLAEPDSAAGLARKLGWPRQRLNYHLRALEKDGFIEFVEERRRGNCVERIVRATARSYLINPDALGALGTTPDGAQDRFSASYLIAVAARAIRELASLVRRAGAADKRLATLTLQTDLRFARAADRQAFAKELTNEIARLTAKYHDDRAAGGRTFRFFMGAYPAPSGEGPEAAKAATSPDRSAKE